MALLTDNLVLFNGKQIVIFFMILRNENGLISV